MRLSGPDTYRYLVDHLHESVYRDGFTIEGIHYLPDPCSVGQTPHGHITGLSAAKMIVDRELADLHVLDICCGVGLVGFTILARLSGKGLVRQMSFADINVFNISSIEKTIKANPSVQRVPIQTFLSDVLKNVPPANQFNLIVSNPPHFDYEPFTEVNLKPTTLGTFDPGWEFHREFYSTCERYLSDRGQVWFLENRLASPEQPILELIGQNPALTFVESFDDPIDPNVFWMISERAG